MSKTRTGRKGRARLAVAADLDALGAARTAADSDSKEDLLTRLMQHATGQGASGQIFSQGEVRGPLPDSIDVTPANGGQGPGIWAQDETDLVEGAGGAAGLSANVTGETTLAAQPEVPQLSQPFAHYYMTEAGTSATTTSGIAYLPSGPAGAFTPKSLEVDGGQSVSISVRPDVSDLAAATSFNNMYFGVTGSLEAGDSVVGRVSSHTQATGVCKFDDATVAEIDAGDELIFVDANGATTLQIKFQADGYQNNAIEAGVTDNFLVESSTLISVLEGDVAGQSDTAARVVDNIVAAIAAWNAAHSDAITAADDTDKVVFTINSSKGDGANNAGGGEAAPLGKNTITARRLRPAAEGEVAVATPIAGLAASGEGWLLDNNDNLTRVILQGVAGAGVGKGNTAGVTEGTPFSIDGSSPNTDAGNAVKIGHEDAKFKHCDIDITVTIDGGDDTTSRAGVAFFWSLS